MKFLSFLRWLIPLFSAKLELMVIYSCEYFAVYNTLFSLSFFFVSSLIYETILKRSLKLLRLSYSFYYCLQAHEIQTSSRTQYIHFDSVNRLCCHLTNKRHLGWNFGRLWKIAVQQQKFLYTINKTKQNKLSHTSSLKCLLHTSIEE